MRSVYTLHSSQPVGHVLMPLIKLGRLNKFSNSPAFPREIRHKLFSSIKLIISVRNVLPNGSVTGANLHDAAEIQLKPKTRTPFSVQHNVHVRSL